MPATSPVEPTATTAAPPAAPREPVPVEIIDAEPTRVRRSLDLVRLGSLAIILALLAGVGTVASDAARGANDDLARLLSEIPHVFVRTFSLVGNFGALAVPLAFMAREIVRGQTRRLIEALLTGVITIGIIEGLDKIVAALPRSALHSALAHVGTNSSVRPLDAYLAALFAFVAVIGVSGDPVWRAALLALTALYVVSAFTTTQASLLSLLLSLTIGVTVGIAVRYLAGSVNEWPDGSRIAAELAVRGVPLARLQRLHLSDDDHRTYVGTTPDGSQLSVLVFDRDLIASGAIHSVSRLIRVRSEIAPAPALSLERAAERRSLLTMASTAAGAPVPELLAGVPCGPDTIVLVYRRPEAAPLLAPTDAQLDELWAAVGRMHHARVTHRGLTAGSILVDPDGHIVLPIPADGAAFASELRISLDRAQLLITASQLAGAERAVRSARTSLSDDELAATLPLLQPIALIRETRQAIRRNPALLDSLREEVQDQIHQQDLPELVRVERVRPRTIISVVAVIVAAYLIVGQLGSVNLGTVFRSARWQWLPLVLLASAGTYFAAALSLTGYVREKLSFTHTVLAQLAASFAGFLTPPSVGGLAVNIRYLRKAKVSITGAATSVGMSQVVNAVAHVVLLIGFAAATGATADHSLPIPGWAFVAFGAAAALVLVVLAIPSARRWLVARVLPPLREALPRLLNLLTSPTKLAESVGGSLLLNGCYIAALWFAVRAFDGNVTLAQVAVVYLAGAAVGSVAPTPGGLGAVELAMSTGLAAVGMSSAAAISAVLLFRLATFWLPVPIGWVALHILQRQDAL